jgi:hypothetical protein
LDDDLYFNQEYFDPGTNNQAGTLSFPRMHACIHSFINPFHPSSKLLAAALPSIQILPSPKSPTLFFLYPKNEKERTRKTWNQSHEREVTRGVLAEGEGPALGVACIND